MSENPFLKLYITTESSELLDIIHNPSDYQSLAVEAAKLELDRRQLTQDQLADAKAKQVLKRQDKANKQQKVKDLENKIKSVGSSLADSFNPIQNETPTTHKLIKLISLFICVIFLYQLYKEFDLLKFMLTGNGQWDLSMVLYFLPFIILPTAGLLFWFRKKIGWTLAAIYFSYTAAGAILMFIMNLNRKQTIVQALDAVIPTTSPIVYIGTVLVFSGLTWTICKENIREVYQVDKKTMFFALIIGTGIIILMAISFGL